MLSVGLSISKQSTVSKSPTTSYLPIVALYTFPWFIKRDICKTAIQKAEDRPS